jgi:hypothetical protein
MEFRLTKRVCVLGMPVLAVVLACGCVSMGSFLPGSDGPPTGPVCQVVATWNNEVAYAPDPTHGGKPTPGLAGRVYLFGSVVDFPQAGEGKLVVDLYDETQAPASGPALPLEEWRIDKDTLQRLLRRDVIGWGYTVFLPWGTYKPEIQKVRLKVRFEPVHGTPIYSEDAPLALSKNEMTQTNVQTVPGQQPRLNLN